MTMCPTLPVVKGITTTERVNSIVVLTSEDTSSNPFPCQGSMIRRQPGLSQTQAQSWEPNSWKISN